MNLHEVAARLGLEILVPGNGLQQQVTGGCTAALPREALGRHAAGPVWITSRVHRTALAVAALVVALLATLLSSFEASCRIYELLR